MKKRKQKGDCKTMKMKKFIAVVSMVGMLALAFAPKKDRLLPLKWKGRSDPGRG